MKSENEPKEEIAFKQIVKIKPRRDVFDHTYISLKNKYMFHTVGKAANSTVKQLFYALELEGTKYAMPSVHDRLAAPLLSPFQLDSATFQAVLTTTQYLRFTFVRNPYSRLLSCYLDRIKAHSSRPYKELVQYLGKDVGYEPSFDEFITAICNQNPFSQNNHWRVQYYDAMMPVVLYDFIGKQENFNTDMDRLMNQITGSERSTGADKINASPSETSSSERLSEFWNPVIARLIQVAYEKDFQAFDYNPDPEWLTLNRPKGKNLEPSQEPKSMIKRSIRLKEFAPNTKRTVTPPDQYIQQTNGTLLAEEYTLTADKNGFLIDPETKNREGHQFILIGDSFVECSYIHQGQRLCDQITKRMKSGIAINAGYSGSTTLNIYSNIINKIVNRNNFSVMYVVPSNDVLSLSQSDGFWNTHDRRYSPILPAEVGEIKAGDFFQNHIQFQNLIESLCDLSRNFAFDLTLATMPFVSLNYSELGWFKKRHKSTSSYDSLIEKRRYLNQILCEISERKRVRLFDLEADLSDGGLFYDDVHLNVKGCEYLSKLLTSRLSFD